jgi:hypothetical protein
MLAHAGGPARRAEERSMSLRRFLAVAAAVALITVLAGSSAVASETKTFNGVKDCGPTFPNPPLCVFVQSSLKVLRGASAHYTAIQGFSDHIYSPITITATDKKNSTATGQCTFFFGGANAGTGHCEYWSGTGKLAGFHAMFKIATVGPHLFSVTGPYGFDRHDNDDED